LFQRLASDFMSNYIFITVGRVGSSTDLIEQTIEFVNDGEKRGFLLNLLQKQSVSVANSKVFTKLTNFLHLQWTALTFFQDSLP
jgi:ATP-dependent RNA helicase DDX3X